MLRLAGTLLVFSSLVLAGDTVAPLGKYTPAELRHWAFQKRLRPTIPVFSNGADRSWAGSAIDAFILQRLRTEGLNPQPPADRATLIRRLSYDLTGLPPTPAEVEAFLKDKSPNAWQTLVDRKLADPRYGEKWGQHWLDVVRYSDTDGFEYDTHRPNAWRYRDYVIRAFNNDKPFNVFVQEQLAGDEISSAEDETLIAAGFNRLGPVRKNAGNQEVASSRNEVLTEMTNMVGAGLLGVTLGCARCHDHKFDPLRQSDYYRIQAFFAGVYPNDVVRASEEEQAAHKVKADPIEAEIKRLSVAIKANKTGEGLTALQKQLEDAEDNLPPALPAIYSVRDDFSKRSSIHLLARGDYQAKGDRVGMRPLGVLLPPETPELPESTPKPRVELAKWVTDPANPLFARVMVNRIWEYHFGRGIVATPNDFGRMGERPTHPELLDELANQFAASGFSVKQMHRAILLSNTYLQSSTETAEAHEKDPNNRWLSHFSRRRLEAEEIRDSLLSLSGELNGKAGGPGVIVPIETSLVSALYKPSQWTPAKDPAEWNRRGVYLISKRNLQLPFMQVFDAPDAQVSCPRRETSTHAPQALEMLNGKLATEQAKAFAQRLLKDAGTDPGRQISTAYQLAAGRMPTTAERSLAIAFLAGKTKEEVTVHREQFALAIFNLNSFLYVN